MDKVNRSIPRQLAACDLVLSVEARWLLRAIVEDDMESLDRVYVVILADRASRTQVHIGPFPDGVSAAVAMESERERNERAGLVSALTYRIAPLYPPTPAVSSGPSTVGPPSVGPQPRSP